MAVVQVAALSFVAAEGGPKLALSRMLLAVCQPGYVALPPIMAYPMVTALMTMIFGCLWRRHAFFHHNFPPGCDGFSPQPKGHSIGRHLPWTVHGKLKPTSEDGDHWTTRRSYLQ